MPGYPGATRSIMGAIGTCPERGSLYLLNGSGFLDGSTMDGFVVYLADDDRMAPATIGRGALP